jgi:IS5 family transposase
VDKGLPGPRCAELPPGLQISQKRGVHGQIKKELRRRSAIEAVIGLCKTDGHLDRNFLKGCDGGQINTVMSAVGYNPRLILKWLKKLLRKIIAAIWAAITPRSMLKQAY